MWIPVLFTITITTNQQCSSTLQCSHMLLKLENLRSMIIDYQKITIHNCIKASTKNVRTSNEKVLNALTGQKEALLGYKKYRAWLFFLEQLNLGLA